MAIATLVLEVLGVCAVIVTLLYVAREIRLAREVSATEALNENVTHLSDVCAVFIEHPELYTYLYENADLSAAPDGDERVRVLALADLFADALENAVDRQLGPAGKNRVQWEVYGRDMLDTSPCLRRLVEEHREWWPLLADLLPRTRSEAPAT